MSLLASCIVRGVQERWGKWFEVPIYCRKALPCTRGTRQQRTGRWEEFCCGQQDVLGVGIKPLQLQALCPCRI